MLGIKSYYVRGKVDEGWANAKSGVSKIMRYRTHQGFKLNQIWVIIGLNFLLFIATLIARDLISFFGLQPASVLARPWTIVTNLFIHGGLWHIIANMLALYFFGTYLSRLVGESKFLVVYFCGGILGNIFFILLALLGHISSIRFLGSPLTVAVGASGAIFALGGALAVMRPKLRVFIFPIPVPLPLWVAVIGGFLILSLLALPLNIAWQAHLGGLIFGLAAGYFFRRRERYFF
jgi:membrane associated rhomboid family serine protease